MDEFFLWSSRATFGLVARWRKSSRHDLPSVSMTARVGLMSSQMKVTVPIAHRSKEEKIEGHMVTQRLASNLDD